MATYRVNDSDASRIGFMQCVNCVMIGLREARVRVTSMKRMDKQGKREKSNL